MEKGNKISRRKALVWFRKLLDGVKSIHSRSILHRDLKPGNIFLDDHENMKIGDFGLASVEKQEEKKKEILAVTSLQLQKMKSEKVGTPMYTSPEQENGGNYDEKTDIYSLGLVFYEMLQNFATIHERVIAFNGLRNNHSVSEDFVKKFPKEAEIVLAMTSKSVEVRPTAEKLIPEIEKLIESLDS